MSYQLGTKIGYCFKFSPSTASVVVINSRLANKLNRVLNQFGDKIREGDEPKFKVEKKELSNVLSILNYKGNHEEVVTKLFGVSGLRTEHNESNYADGNIL